MTSPLTLPTYSRVSERVWNTSRRLLTHSSDAAVRSLQTGRDALTPAINRVKKLVQTPKDTRDAVSAIVKLLLSLLNVIESSGMKEVVDRIRQIVEAFKDVSSTKEANAALVAIRELKQAIIDVSQSKEKDVSALMEISASLREALMAVLRVVDGGDGHDGVETVTGKVPHPSPPPINASGNQMTGGNLSFIRLRSRL